MRRAEQESDVCRRAMARLLRGLEQGSYANLEAQGGKWLPEVPALLANKARSRDQRLHACPFFPQVHHTLTHAPQMSTNVHLNFAAALPNVLALPCQTVT